MMDIYKQIEIGCLVSPLSRKKLIISDDKLWLETHDKKEKYRITENKVPIFLQDIVSTDNHNKASSRMKEEYDPEKLTKKANLLPKLKAKLINGYRTKTAKTAFNNIFDDQGDDFICLSIGGGPSREHSSFINLNIDTFPNVDIVADAHMLPYADETVDAIYCDAVLEHLSNPAQAVTEMFRVLKKEGKVFSGIPFLQQYHGFPNHYQNYTLTGHKHLFEANKFCVLEVGVCVGPVYTMFDLAFSFVSNYSPKLIKWPIGKILTILAIMILPLDMILAKHRNAYVLASSTYLVAKK